MTLILIFGAIFVVFGIVAIVANKIYWKPSVRGTIAGVLCVVEIIFGIISGICGVGLIASTFAYIPSHRSSEIEYMQLVQEKQAIEQMIDSGEAVDKLTLNQRVIDYNNRIIENQENYKRPIIKDYYSPNVDWEALELIEWK